MRLVIRFLVALGLLLSIGLSPLADATEDPSPSTASTASGTASPRTSSAPSSASPDESASPSGTASPRQPSGDPTGTPTETLGKQAGTAAAEVADPRLAVTIDARPTSVSVDRNPTFTWHVDSINPTTTFRCTLLKNGETVQGPEDCTVGKTVDTEKTTGTASYSGLAPAVAPYTLKVVASTTAPAAQGAPTTADWHLYSVTAPDTYQPGNGASFNNPLGSTKSRRTNLRRVIRTINSMPGYAQPAESRAAPCPKDSSAQVPGTIKITLYSMTDGYFAKAMIAASRRCLRTQILMNAHLDAENDPAWRTLQNALGRDRNARRFARRCIGGCRGKLLHTKMYLFNSTVPAPLSDRDRNDNTVMVGSSNMTFNASSVQWNDLYTTHDSRMFSDYSRYFDLMKRDDGFHRNPHDFVSKDGDIRTTMWPVAANRREPYLSALSQIKCSGARSSGINGHTVVYINMHAWFGERGLAIQRKVRDLYSRGCYIKILYSFMTPRVYHRLHDGTGSRMSMRRTVFSLDGDRYADVYSHFKMIAASGNIAGDANNQVVYTGSNNFTSDGDHFDEIMIRIHRSSAYRQYRDRFQYISRHKSSARYAQFFEAQGGGRAPTPKLTAAQQAPTVLSDAVVQDPDGSLRAVD